MNKFRVNQRAIIDQGSSTWNWQKTAISVGFKILKSFSRVKMKLIVSLILIINMMSEISTFPVQHQSEISQLVNNNNNNNNKNNNNNNNNAGDGMNVLALLDTNENTVEDTSNAEPSTELPRKIQIKKRYRRSFGFKAQCIPEEVTKCKVFNVDGIEKKFCVIYTQSVCTALD